MPRKNNAQYTLSKLNGRKLSLEDIPKKTMMVTVYALRWVFFLIFLFIIVGILALFFTGGEGYIQQIIGYSITGFFTFFMGYFGWILAQGVIDTISGKEDKPVESFSYYLKRRKNHKHH
jgi:hypothetical protein